MILILTILMTTDKIKEKEKEKHCTNWLFLKTKTPLR